MLHELTADSPGNRHALDTRLPEHRLAPAVTAPDLVAKMLRDELLLDGAAAANLGTFSTSWMEPEADELLLEAARKNFVDVGAYPIVAEYERRCVHMLADLFHCPAPGGAGTSTTGSSEAIYLALTAHRVNWRRGGGTGRPNVVATNLAHTSLNKFCAFFDVELRAVPHGPQLTINIAELEALIDEQTVAIVAVAGSCETGRIDDLEAIDALAARRGVAVHVDAASGGFVLPFSEPDRRWDFRLPSVKSINVSGHKYGLAYPGIGWLVLRDKRLIPEELIHATPYLSGGAIRDFSLSFTRSAAGVVAQYFNFVHHGREGYQRAVTRTLVLARYLSTEIEEMGAFRILNDPALPIVCFCSVDPDVSIERICQGLRSASWLDSVYEVGDTRVRALRIVLKHTMTTTAIEQLVDDLYEAHRLARGELRRGRRHRRLDDADQDGRSLGARAEHVTQQDQEVS